MFVAIDQLGNKVNPIENTTEELRLLSKSKMIYCPECKNIVKFAAGEHITAHFKHSHSCDCTYESEPETEEHRKGKMLIRNWLIETYSDVVVEFEYKIIQTNQRADVMAFFPGGKKVAFEIQCSKIQGSVWKERNVLYKKAGIQDFWILGHSVHKYGKTKGEEDVSKHQLVSLASTIYQQEGAVLFLDTINHKIKGIYKHKFRGWHSETILKINEENYLLSEARLFKKLIGTKSIRDDFKVWYMEKERKRQLAEERDRLYNLEEEKREREYHEYINLLKGRFDNYLNDLKQSNIAFIKNKMSNNEKNVFDRLMKKHGFNDNNFPGLFNIYTNYNHLIYTPHQLWQLWIYDKFLYQRTEPYDKVWIPKIKDELFKMTRKGIFRLTAHSDDDAHFSFALYDYFKKISKLDIVMQLGRKYYKIRTNVFPIYEGKDVHDYVAYFLSTLEKDEILLDNSMPEPVRFYKVLIKSYKGETSKVDEGRLSALEYTDTLMKAKPELSNDWEKDFIAQMLRIHKKGYALSEKQKLKVETIVKRIEKTLQISI